MGLSDSKFGARYKAVDQAMSVLAAMRVTVNPVQRRWKDKNYPDIVLARAGEVSENLPPFFSPPAGTADHSLEQERKKRGDKILKSVTEGDKLFSRVGIIAVFLVKGINSHCF